MLLKAFQKSPWVWIVVNALRAQMAELRLLLLHLELFFLHVDVSVKALFFAQVVAVCNCVISSPITRKSTQREHLQRNC